MYAGIQENEREAFYRDITEQEDTVMLAQYIKEKGFQEGRQEGKQEGWQEGKREGKRIFLERLLIRRFGLLPDWGKAQLAGATSEQLDRWSERVLEVDSIQGVLAE